MELLVYLKLVGDRPAKGLSARDGAFEERLPGEGVLVAPDREEAGDIAAACRDQVELRVLLEDDEIFGGIVVESLEGTGLGPGPILAGDKTAVGYREAVVVGKADGDVELAEFVGGFELREEGVWEPTDGDEALTGVFEVNLRAYSAAGDTDLPLEFEGVFADALRGAHGDRCVGLRDVPGAEILDGIAREVAVADADDLPFGVGAFGAQRIVVEGGEGYSWKGL